MSVRPLSASPTHSLTPITKSLQATTLPLLVECRPLASLSHLIELSLFGNPLCAGVYPSLEGSILELGSDDLPRNCVGGVRLRANGKLECRGFETVATVSTAAETADDLVEYSRDSHHPMPVRCANTALRCIA